jgi:hypothetical protein
MTTQLATTTLAVAKELASGGIFRGLPISRTQKGAVTD